MFFAKSGVYEPCRMYTKGHFTLLFITILCIVVALEYVIKNKKDIRKTIRYCTIFVWIYEVIIIYFKISKNGTEDVNDYLPLYYCSLLLYAGFLSSFTEGKLKRAGDVFLATGAIVGGATYLVYPSTSLPWYPMFHLVSFHSFMFHGMMVYLGILINMTGYIAIKKKDIIGYSSLVGVACLAAYITNNIFDSNLMFISKNFPGTILEVIYNSTGKFFPLVTILAQMFLPFYAVFGILKLINKYQPHKIIDKDEQEANEDEEVLVK